MKTILAEEGYPLALRETYIALIEGSIGSNQYRKLFVHKDGQPLDVIGDGDLACAYYVSSILTLCCLINGGVHTTVRETIKDLRNSGWKKTDALSAGSVIVWEPKLCTDGIKHAHIGFYIGNNYAVSTSSTKRIPDFHHVTFGIIGDTTQTPVRNIAHIFTHPKLR